MLRIGLDVLASRVEGRMDIVKRSEGFGPLQLKNGVAVLDSASPV
jgi:hypothetical protein